MPPLRAFLWAVTLGLFAGASFALFATISESQGREIPMLTSLPSTIISPHDALVASSALRSLAPPAGLRCTFDPPASETVAAY